LSSATEQAGLDDKRNSFLKHLEETKQFVDKNDDFIDDYSYIPPTEEERNNVKLRSEKQARVMEIDNILKNSLDDFAAAYP
jgi:hypothetical protein